MEADIYKMSVVRILTDSLCRYSKGINSKEQLLVLAEALNDVTQDESQHRFFSMFKDYVVNGELDKDCSDR